MERHLTDIGPVLDKDGRPVPGYSTKSVLRYDRKAIKAPPWRIKEWDFYQITDDQICLQFTIGHASYAGQVLLMAFDFSKGEKLFECGTLLPLPFGSLNMPPDAEKDAVLSWGKGSRVMSFETKNDVRTLHCVWDDVRADVKLTRKNPNALVINIPFSEKPTEFYYNHKINCMTAEGGFTYSGKEYQFGDRAFGLLDWGRGVWPFSNEWYWSSGTGIVNGEIFGFNLGCGFGNTSAATENILFYAGEAHKIGPVAFELGEKYMQPWRLHDREDRVDLTLTPSYDRTTKTKMLWIDNECHQMFGKFAGSVVLNDGQKIVIDNLYSFAEFARNHW
ncbi:MAG TPA: DUF2804 domain-containing protein [Oscillospiraceae bacterium]|nr:DUF2804 domain-containing protein [Oscillospiraceae bacterium]HPF55523.1 DUF2804 domain-containing protein [Clostridiales bacterium]HPK35703.1 DUF2804 domain-containing protein [Oscillospiraceae bacterium]HPR76566.1 DUF2804 domain-containing protein [Oscillospiraceae bacterium]